jgi:hypothetical protein
VERGSTVSTATGIVFHGFILALKPWKKRQNKELSGNRSNRRSRQWWAICLKTGLLVYHGAKGNCMAKTVLLLSTTSVAQESTYRVERFDLLTTLLFIITIYHACNAPYQASIFSISFHRFVRRTSDDNTAPDYSPFDVFQGLTRATHTSTAEPPPTIRSSVTPGHSSTPSHHQNLQVIRIQTNSPLSPVHTSFQRMNQKSHSTVSNLSSQRSIIPKHS